MGQAEDGRMTDCGRMLAWRVCQPCAPLSSLSPLPARSLLFLASLWPLELDKSTAPALWRLDGQCAANNAYMNKCVVANYNATVVQAAMSEQDNEYLVLDDMDSEGVSIMVISYVRP